MNDKTITLNKPIFRQAMEIFLTLRAMLFLGNKLFCPCCGWQLRAFTHAGMSFRIRSSGYCPRCNSKARHRRNMLYFERNTTLFRDPLRLLHVSPKFCMSRKFIKMSNLDYVGVDIKNNLNINSKMDITATSFESSTFDCVICIHVLEHVENDNKAISEIYRVLKPGGWASISVPIRLDQKTYEDPKIITPEDREREFGETNHVRYYGYDLFDRLNDCGFVVQLDLGENIEQEDMQKFGLLDDENIFFCRKPAK